MGNIISSAAAASLRAARCSIQSNYGDVTGPVKRRARFACFSSWRDFPPDRLAKHAPPDGKARRGAIVESDSIAGSIAEDRDCRSSCSAACLGTETPLLGQFDLGVVDV